MSDPYLGEIKVISFGFAPKGWALCNGQTLPINQNQALFAVLSTQYGGDGVTTFALPNLQGQVPVHQGNGNVVGNSGGEASHTLAVGEIPNHTHLAQARSAASSPGGDPTNAVWAAATNPMFAATANAAMSPTAIGNAGNGQPHENRSPYLVLNFIIALSGVFPSRN